MTKRITWKGVSRYTLPSFFKKHQDIIYNASRHNMDIDDIIAGGGIMFRPERKENDGNGKVKTKAKKKKYITGAHGSGSARQKAKYREQRANRHKGK